MASIITQCVGWAGSPVAQPGLPPDGQQPRLALNSRNPKTWTASLLAGAAMLGSLVFGHPAVAQQPQTVYAPGDAVVTGFAGIRPPEGAPPKGSNPLDEFFIDPDGASMKIFKIGRTGQPPQGQVLNAAADFMIPASEIGQVFAIALEDNGDGQTPPNIYLGATSVYGLNIVVPGPDGRPKRTAQGGPGAMWMDGQFGTAKNGGPGSIWRVDATTGEMALFTTIPGNSGPGIGNIVYDKTTHQFFASDLDTGLIHRIGADGTVIDSFDHGTMARPAAGLPPLPDDGRVADIASPAFSSEKPESWGFTPRERMVWGLALQGGRLYYAVQGGPEIWSVGIGPDGGFANDAHPELRVEGLSGGTYISDMLFDARGMLYLAQRGEFRGSYDYSVFAEPRRSDVLRYARDPQSGQWSPVPQSYAIGFPEGYKNASGGIAIGACNTMLWTTGDNLRNNPAYAAQLTAGGPLDVHGLQGNNIDLVRPQNEPPLQSYFVDYDGQFGDPEKAGHVGDVKIWQVCKRDSAGVFIPEPVEIIEIPACPPGFAWNGEICERGFIIVRFCPPRMWRHRDHCCPFGHEWDGRRCRHQDHPDCPPGTIGRYPHCHYPICPPGTAGRPPHCHPITHACPPGMIGTPPRCHPILHLKCPVGMIGTPPHCHPLLHPKCPAGMAGTPPNCHRIFLHCPKGTVRRNGTCVQLGGSKPQLKSIVHQQQMRARHQVRPHGPIAPLKRKPHGPVIR